MNREPDSSGSNILAVSSLCVFDLVDFPIKTYFIFRYARYAIKSDYLNLMFELCLRFFYLTSYLKQKKIYFPFLFLNLEFFFSRTRGSDGAIANPYAISYYLNIFYCSKLWKNLTSCTFFSGKACKTYLEFPVNWKFARIILLLT